MTQTPNEPQTSASEQADGEGAPVEPELNDTYGLQEVTEEDEPGEAQKS